MWCTHLVWIAAYFTPATRTKHSSLFIRCTKGVCKAICRMAWKLQGSDSAEAPSKILLPIGTLTSPTSIKMRFRSNVRTDYAKSFLPERTVPTAGRPAWRTPLDATGFANRADKKKLLAAAPQQGHRNDNAFASRATNLICADEKSSRPLRREHSISLCFIIQTTSHKVQRVHRFSVGADWKMAWTWSDASVEKLILKWFFHLAESAIKMFTMNVVEL